MGRYADGAFCQFTAALTLRSASAALVCGMGRVPAADSKASRDDRPVGFWQEGSNNELLLTAEKRTHDAPWRIYRKVAAASAAATGAITTSGGAA